MNKWDLMKLTIFVMQRTLSIGQKWQPKGWENIFTNCTSDKMLIRKYIKNTRNQTSTNKIIQLKIRSISKQRILSRGISGNWETHKETFNIYLEIPIKNSFEIPFYTCQKRLRSKIQMTAHACKHMDQGQCFPIAVGSENLTSHQKN